MLTLYCISFFVKPKLNPLYGHLVTNHSMQLICEGWWVGTIMYYAGTMCWYCAGMCRYCAGMCRYCAGIVQVLCKYVQVLCTHSVSRYTLHSAEDSFTARSPELVSSDLHLTIHKMHIWAFANSHFTLHICELGHRALNCGLCLTLQMRMSKKWSG